MYKIETLRACYGDSTQILAIQTRFLKNPQIKFSLSRLAEWYPKNLEISTTEKYDVSAFKRTFERLHMMTRSKITLF